jgi:ABC-type amino acid transport substrate-binding protein
MNNGGNKLKHNDLELNNVNNKNLTEKKKKKIFVITGPPMSGITATRIIGGGKDDYKGFAYDVWKEIEKDLKNKYDFEVSFSKEDDVEYDRFVSNTEKDVYDMVIGLFAHTPDRMKKVDYTLPIAIDGNAILHMRENTLIDRMLYVLNDIKILFFYLCMFGLLIGVILFITDKERTHSSIKNKNFLSMFLRTILTGFAATMGEMGFLAENASMSLGKVIIVIILMLISFIFIMFIQAEITSSMVGIETDLKYKKEEIRRKRFLTCYAVPGSYIEKFERYGAIVEHFTGTEDEMVEKYKNNTKKYQGCIITYLDGYKYERHDPELVLTGAKEYGYEPMCFIVGKNDSELKDDVNNKIMELEHSLQLHAKCHEYYEDVENKVPVCELT